MLADIVHSCPVKSRTISSGELSYPRLGNLGWKPCARSNNTQSLGLTSRGVGCGLLGAPDAAALTSGTSSSKAGGRASSDGGAESGRSGGTSSARSPEYPNSSREVEISSSISTFSGPSRAASSNRGDQPLRIGGSLSTSSNRTRTSSSMTTGSTEGLRQDLLWMYSENRGGKCAWRRQLRCRPRNTRRAGSFSAV